MIFCHSHTHSLSLCSRLRTHVETCVRFLAALGAHTVAVRPETALRAFAVETLSIQASDWAQATTPSIDDLVGGLGRGGWGGMESIFIPVTIFCPKVQLQHLQALYVLLADYAQGGVLCNVHEAYKLPLPEVGWGLEWGKAGCLVFRHDRQLDRRRSRSCGERRQPSIRGCCFRAWWTCWVGW